MKLLPLLTFGSLVLLAGCQPRESSIPAPAPEPEQQQAPAITPEQPEETPPTPLPVPSPTNSMVGINATNQGYAMVQPWSKENPSYSEGFGIYLGDGNILTAANIVYSASFVEVTSSDGSQTVPEMCIRDRYLTKGGESPIPHPPMSHKVTTPVPPSAKRQEMLLLEREARKEAIERKGKNYRFWPVSYTHLDVYKRQTYV